MKKRLVAIVLALILSGCASERIVIQAEKYGYDMNSLPIREVFTNLSKAVYDPNHIPSRTTFGEGKLTFTDTGGVSAGIPLFASARGGALVSAKVGDLIDQYNIGISPETDPEALLQLRNLYRQAVYPEMFHPATTFGRKHVLRWLFWTNRSGHNGPERAPPTNAYPVGSTDLHDFYSTSSETFSDFILSSFGSETLLGIRPHAAKGGAAAKAKPVAPPSLAAADRGRAVIPARRPPVTIQSSPPVQTIQ